MNQFLSSIIEMDGKGIQDTSAIPLSPNPPNQGDLKLIEMACKLLNRALCEH
jgi:hypothetical protein